MYFGQLKNYIKRERGSKYYFILFYRNEEQNELINIWIQSYMLKKKNIYIYIYIWISGKEKKLNKYNQIPELFVSSPLPKFPMEEVFETAEEMVTTNHGTHPTVHFSLSLPITCFSARFTQKRNVLLLWPTFHNSPQLK